MTEKEGNLTEESEEMKEGDPVYHKLDNRKMVIIKKWRGIAGYECRYLDEHGAYESHRFYEHELSKTKAEEESYGRKRGED